MNKIVFSILIVTISFFGSMASARKRVAVFQDWAVFTADKHKECWLVSAAAKVENTRSGKPAINVTRGNIILWVSILPKQKVYVEVAFTVGYPFKKGKMLKLQIGSAKYDLISKGDYAWSASPEIDTKIRVSMTKGSTAIVTAESQRGTKTKDTFSLRGFTAALKDAKSRCGI